MNYIVEFYVNGKMVANVSNTSSPVTVEDTDIGDLTYGSSVSNWLCQSTQCFIAIGVDSVTILFFENKLLVYT